MAIAVIEGTNRNGWTGVWFLEYKGRPVRVNGINGQLLRFPTEEEAQAYADDYTPPKPKVTPVVSKNPPRATPPPAPPPEPEPEPEIEKPLDDVKLGPGESVGKKKK